MTEYRAWLECEHGELERHEAESCRGCVTDEPHPHENTTVWCDGGREVVLVEVSWCDTHDSPMRTKAYCEAHQHAPCVPSVRLMEKKQ